MANESQLLLQGYLSGIAPTPNATQEKLFVPKSNKTPFPFTLVFGFIGVLVILFNGLVVAIFIKKRELRKRKSHLFLLSLAAADFLVGFSSIGYLFCLKSNYLAVFAKQVSTIVLGFSLETSIFSLWCITYERLIGVKDSLKYQKIVTTYTVNTAIIATWVIAAFMTCASGVFAFTLEDGKYFELNGVVIVVLATTTSVFLTGVYFYLYKEIRRHGRDIRSTSVSVSNSIDFDMIATKSLDDTLDIDNRNHLDVTQESMLHVPRKRNVKLIQLNKEKRSLVLCTFIVCSFSICWTPITVFFAGQLLRQEYMTKDYMLYFSLCLVLLNSLIDPLVYFALRNDLRRAALSVLCKRGTRR